jgi:5-methylcytosine-specific restriction endonuclease McrA
MSCLHHFWPKSKSSALRYDWDNLIPICHKCHLAHHTGDPSIHAEVIKIKGADWYDRLERTKDRTIVKTNKGWYESKIAALEKVIKN